MTRRQITPCEFANLIRRAQTYRAEGAPTIIAAATACRDEHLSADWAIPVLGLINSSPTAAEAWAERMFVEALDRAGARVGTFE